MTAFDSLREALPAAPGTWLVTGAAGFIGSSLAEELLRLGQRVVALDNFETGRRHNLEDLLACVGPAAADRFRFIRADIRDPDACMDACRGVDVVLHQAALGSVPRSIANPQATNSANITGFLNMLVAARDAGVARFIYAASSSTYGDHPALPKVEENIGRPLSPYAVTKYVNELYASVFQRTYGIQVVGLRYFNVFGKRQDPEGAYAAVIPRWIATLLAGSRCIINGDGETTRDFCFIDNVVEANLLAAHAPAEATDRVYNVAFGGRTTLNDLFRALRDGLAAFDPAVARLEPVYADFRVGDVRHSQADITSARTRLGYEPRFDLAGGLAKALPWYVTALAPAVRVAP